MEWQPIEEAPEINPMNEDIPSCLVYGPKCGIQMGRAWRWPSGKATGSAYGFLGDWPITHFMRLPDPPK